MNVNRIEKTLIKNFLLSLNISVDGDNKFFADVSIKERRLTGIGFFTDLEKSEKLKVGNEGETYIYSKAGAKINHSIETGYLVYVKDGYLDCIEGFTYGEPWPENIAHIQPYILSD